MRAILFLLVSFIAAGSAAADVRIVGTAEALDGDTLAFGPVRVRLHGVDAPEGDQTCRLEGEEWDCAGAATERLAALVEGREIECLVRDVDRYGRLVAACYAGGADVGEALVRDGLAWAYRHYSLDYVAAERAAKAARRGIWQGSAMPPWKWRQQRREGR